MSTYFPSGKDLAGRRKWYVIDAAGQTVGHLASEVASILSGKRSPQWTPFLDMGDHVVVINAEHVGITGKNKPDDKIYYSHSRYPGGLHSESMRHLMGRFPTRVIEHSVRGMLPKNSLGREIFRKLHVYAGPNHPHSGQMKEQS